METWLALTSPAVEDPRPSGSGARFNRRLTVPLGMAYRGRRESHAGHERADVGGAPMTSLQRLVPYAVYVAALLYYVAASPHSIEDFPLDDAWIHRVYSSAFAHGHGFQYNRGGPQEAGSTSPFWAIASAPAHWLEGLGTDAVVVAVKLIEVALGLLLLATIQTMGSAVIGSPLAGAFAASLFALEPRLLFSLLSGMENTLLIVLWVRGALAFAQRRYGRSLAWIAFAPVTRPEAVILLPLWLAARWLLDRDRPSLRQHASWLAGWAPAALWSFFCLYANGHWLPTTFYVKAHAFQLSSAAVRQAAEIVLQQGYGSLTCFAAGLAVFVAWASTRWSFESRALLWWLILAPLGYALGVAGGRDLTLLGYYWTRWLDPAALILSIAFALGCGIGVAEAVRIAASVRRSRAGTTTSDLVIAGGGLLVIVWLALSAPRFAASFAASRARLASDSRAIHLLNVRTGEWIRDHTAADARIAVNDAGAIRYIGQRQTLDLVGLNNAALAFRQRQLSPIDMDWLAVFPVFVNGSPLLQYFALREVIEIPLEEYTICPCQGQNQTAILERVAG